jgi:hypothetical protein
MPVEDRLRRDEEWRLALLWDETGEQGDQCPVRRGETGAADLATKDRHLVAQDQDLGVVRDGVPPRQANESEGEAAMDQAVEEGEHHGGQPCRLHSGWSRRWRAVSGPFRSSLKATQARTVTSPLPSKPTP